MRVYEQIRKCRKQFNFSQEELADKIYVSRQTISNWENGKSYPDIENLLILSTLFHISLDELIKGDIGAMRKEIDNHRMNIWTGVMLTFLIFGTVVGIPLSYVLSWWGVIITVIFFAIGIGASIKVELIKRKYDIETFKEIVAFTENSEFNSKNKLKGCHWKSQILMMIFSALFTLILAWGVLVITKMIIKS